MINPVTGDKQPNIAAPKQAKNISNLKSHNSPIITHGLIDTSFSDTAISASLLSKCTSSSVFLLLILVFFLCISSILFWVSISS